MPLAATEILTFDKKYNTRNMTSIRKIIHLACFKGIFLTYLRESKLFFLKIVSSPVVKAIIVYLMRLIKNRKVISSYVKRNL